MPINDLYSLAEVAAELDVTIAAVRKAIERGTLASEKLGWQRVVRRAELERYRRENLGNVGQPTIAEREAKRRRHPPTSAGS